MPQQWWAGGLALLSLALPTGWWWLKNKQPKPQTWPKLAQRWPARTAEFFYFVGLPYLALVFGLFPARMLGLQGFENFASRANQSSPVAGLPKAVALMLLDNLADGGPVLGAGLMALFIWGGLTWALAHYGIRPQPVQTSALDTVYCTLHWAFYWALFGLITGDRYLGLVLGAAWAILEMALLARRQKKRLAQTPPFLLTIIILILTSAIFYYRPNLCWLWIIHLAMVFWTTRVYPEPKDFQNL
ncbi:MAG: hypothetical protein JW953_05145 [Anaerolineae bacterium]|nr:hypothetical protein [Anaerolineae bacterium]